MIPGLREHSEGIQVSTKCETEQGQESQIQLPSEIIFKILDDLSLNRWRLMNQLSKLFARDMEGRWKELSKKEGLSIAWPGCPLDAQPKADLPYPEQTRYFQGKLLQDYLCSPAFLKFGPFGIDKRMEFKSTKLEVNSLSPFEIQTFLTEDEKKLYGDPNFNLTVVQFDGRSEEEKINLDKIYQSFKKRMIVFPIVGEYIWSDLTHLARMIPNSSLPLEEGTLFESYKLSFENESRGHLLDGLFCLQKVFNQTLSYFRVNNQYLVRYINMRIQKHFRSSLQCLRKAISEGGTLASQFAFKILNRGYFRFYQDMSDPTVMPVFTSLCRELSFFSNDQGDSRGVSEYFKYLINHDKTSIRMIATLYEQGHHYPYLLVNLATLPSNNIKKNILLKLNFRGYGPNLSEKSKELLIEGRQDIQGRKKIQTIVKKGQLFPEHNVWYQKTWRSIQAIVKDLKGNHNDPFFFALEMEELTKRISTNCSESIRENLAHANLLIKTTIQYFEDKHVSVPVEIWCTAAIVKWVQQDRKSAKNHIDKLFETSLSQQQPWIVYQILIAFLGSLDSDSEEFKSYVKKIPVEVWFEIASRAAKENDKVAAGSINIWFMKALSVYPQISRTGWLVAGLLQDMAFNIDRGIECISNGLKTSYYKNENIKEENYLTLLILNLSEKLRLPSDMTEGQEVYPEIVRQIDDLYKELVSVAINLVEKTEDRPHLTGFCPLIRGKKDFSVMEKMIILIEQMTGHDRRVQARLLAGICHDLLKEEEILKDIPLLLPQLGAWIERAIAIYDHQPPPWIQETAVKIKSILN